MIDCSLLYIYSLLAFIASKFMSGGKADITMAKRRVDGC